MEETQNADVKFVTRDVASSVRLHVIMLQQHIKLNKMRYFDLTEGFKWSSSRLQYTSLLIMAPLGM